MVKAVFDDIAAGLEDAIAIGEGRVDPGAYRVHLPRTVDVREIRKRIGLTQEAFAASYGFPLTTLRDWEQGRARPDTSARAYLVVISRQPQVVREALLDRDGFDTRSSAVG